MELVTRGLLTQAVIVGARLGIPDLVAAGPRSIEERAAETGSDPAALARLVRALVALGVLSREDDGRVAATPLSRAFEDGPLRAFAAWAGEIWTSWGALDHSVATGDPAFRHVHGVGVFEHLARDAEAAALFQSWMTAQSQMQTPPLLGAIDLEGVRWLVDVGGGRGALLAALLEEWQEVRGTLYDLPEVVAGAADLRGDAVAGRAEAVGGDFFEGVPAGADRYVLKFILHDWDDERASRILGSVRRAIPPHGRLLVLEHVLPEDDGYSHAVWLDLNMLALTDGGRERSESEYRDLLAGAGFELLRITGSAGALQVLEAAPV
jgi:O-methyltransferase domain